MTRHKLITRVNNHGIVSPLGPYANAAARQAEVLTSAQEGLVAHQTDTHNYWMVGYNGTGYSWQQMTSGPEATFSGNFLSVLPGAFQIMVSDQGVTNGGTMIRADQSGNGKDYSATSNQPTTAGTLNGRSTLTLASASRMASTLNLAPGTTPWEFALVVKVTAWTIAQRILGDSADNTVVFAASSTVGDIGVYAGSALGGTTGLALNTWGLVRGSVTNTAGAFIRCGNSAQVTGNPGTVNTTGARIGGTSASSLPCEIALVAYGPVGFSAGAPFLAALDAYYNSLVLHP